MDDVVRKYIRYTLNEKPFNPDVVVDLIHLRKASMLEGAEVAEILNEISRRIVREKGITIAAYSSTMREQEIFPQSQTLTDLALPIKICFHFLLPFS